MQFDEPSPLGWEIVQYAANCEKMLQMQQHNFFSVYIVQPYPLLLWDQLGAAPQNSRNSKEK